MTDKILISDEDFAAVKSALKDAVEAEFSVEIVEVKVYREYGEFAFELLIWKKDGVTLNDCEAVHNRVSELLDGFDDKFLGAYNLKISSMGLDRPIVTDDDFRRALGTEVEAKEGKKSTVGVLKSYDEETFTLATAKGDKILSRKIITKVQPYVRF